MAKKFQLPPKMKVLPKHLKILAGTKSKVPTKFQVPKLIEKKTNPSLRLWFHEDATFLKPTASASFRLWSDIPSGDIHSHVLSYFYTLLFEDHMVSELATLKKGGYSYGLATDKEGMTVEMSGYSDPHAFKNYVLTIMSALRSPAIFKTKRFPILKKIYRHALFGSLSIAPYKIIMGTMNSLLIPGSYHPKTLAKIADQISLEDVQNFAVETLFTDMQMEALFYGNMKPHHAKDILKKVLKVFHFETTSPSFNNPRHEAHSLLRSRLVRLPPAVKYTVRTQHPDPLNTNACVKSYRQYDRRIGQTKQGVLYATLLDKSAKKIIYDTLRTEEQLGYIVWSFALIKEKVPGFVIEVQSSTYNASYLDSRIEALTPKIDKAIKNMNKEQFQALVQTMKDEISRPPMGSDAQNGFFWMKIMKQDYRFNLWQSYMELLDDPKAINKEGLYSFFTEIFSVNKKPTAGGTISVLLDPQHAQSQSSKSHKHHNHHKDHAQKTKVISINVKKPVLHNKQQSKTVFLEEGDHESGLLKPADREEMRPDSFLEEDESESENDDSADNQDVNDKDQDDDDFDRMKKQLAELAEENDDFLEEAKKSQKISCGYAHRY